MEKSVNKKFVFAGGPGAGKTTVLNALSDRDYSCAHDVARVIIRTRLESGLSPRPEPLEFAQSMFDRDVANYTAAPVDRVCFFDRGVVDSLGSLYQCKALSDAELDVSLRRYRYNRLVFLFPPWQEIYQTDRERDQTFAESIRVFDSVKPWYSRCGYQLQEVPVGTPGKRVTFIEDTIAELSTGI